MTVGPVADGVTVTVTVEVTVVVLVVDWVHV